MILKCFDCKNKLTTYEESKYLKLLAHWGGRKVTEPRCVKHYYKNLEGRGYQRAND